MIFFCLTIILISALKVSTNADLDKIADKFDTNLNLQFFGFTNVGNKGKQKAECCNLRDNLTGICLPCKYVVLIILSENTLFYGKQTMDVNLKYYESPIESSVERFTFQRLVDVSSFSKHHLSINTLEPKNIVVDEWDDASNKEYYRYSYENAFGHYTYIKASFKLSVEAINTLTSFRGFQIRVDSINWKNYKDINNKCCKISSDEMCSVPCEFSIAALLGKSVLEETSTIAENPFETSYGLGAVLNLNPLASVYNEAFDLTINIKSVSTSALIDTFVVRNINNIPNVENKIGNLVGSYNNVAINLTLTHVCQRYSGNNCHSYCLYVDGLSKCNYVTADKVCLNGAQDLPGCEKYSTTCEDSLCSNRGKCIVKDKSVTCNCNQGFTGKFCDKFLCINECNGNGECVGPNKCFCKYPFTGNDCEISPCNNSTNYICGKESQCILTKGIPSCICNSLFKGVRCDQPICANRCIFGHCIYVPTKKITTCHCDQFYVGISCDVFNFKNSFNISKYTPMFLTPLIILVLFNLIFISCTIAIYFKYKSVEVGVKF